MGVLTIFYFLKSHIDWSIIDFFGTLGIPQLEYHFPPMHVPLWPTFLIYIHES
jgi:hypothetical protein